MIDLTPIIQAILALLAALITYRLIPWIKERTIASQQENLRATIRVLVFAAEQFYGAGQGKEKMQYVKGWLADRGYDVNEAEIEAAVGEFINHVDLMQSPENETKPPDEVE